VSPLKDTAIFEPFFMDIINNEINEQHARILALMFRLGGYTTLNVLTDHLAIAQPTVSVRVEELVQMNLIRKNTELMPMVLVLLLNIEKLATLLEKRIESQRDAVRFLQKASELDNISRVKDTFFQAITTLYPKQPILTKMIVFIYIHQILSRDALYRKLEPNGKVTKYSTKDYDTIITSHDDIFHVLYGKQRKAEMYIQSRLPLNLLASNRLVYLESLTSYYKTLLSELQSFISEEYNVITPHQLLKYPSDIKKKIDTCLKNYSTIRVIDNSICQKKMGFSILEYLVKSKTLGTTKKKGIQEKEHKLFILSNKKPSILKDQLSPSIQYKTIDKNINRDYSARDFIIFDNHGCLVFPSIPNALPYYNIAPQFTNTSLNVFESNWKL
jgi:hypothetical protein